MFRETACRCVIILDSFWGKFSNQLQLSTSKQWPSLRLLQQQHSPTTMLSGNDACLTVQHESPAKHVAGGQVGQPSLPATSKPPTPSAAATATNSASPVSRAFLHPMRLEPVKPALGLLLGVLQERREAVHPLKFVLRKLGRRPGRERDRCRATRSRCAGRGVVDEKHSSAAPGRLLPPFGASELSADGCQPGSVPRC